MDVSRREFLRFSVAAGTGTALAGWSVPGSISGRWWRRHRRYGLKTPRSRRVSVREEARL
jgi:hypothetical protein